MASRLTTPTIWARAIADSLNDYQVDHAPLMLQLHMDEGILDDPKSTYFQDQVTQFWNLAGKAANDELFGFKAGSRVISTSYPELGYLLMACPNLLSCLEQMHEHQAMLAEGFEIALSEDMDDITISVNIIPCKLTPSQFAIDAMVVSLIHFISWLTQQKASPVEVGLKRSAPKATNNLKNLFEANTVFEQNQNFIKIKKADVEKPLATANPLLFQYYSEQIKAIKESAATTSCRESIQTLLLSHESEGAFTLEYCAKQLHISTSTLKRRLKAEGASFNLVVQEAKSLIAKQYLSKGSMSLSEIAFQLGFSEASAFTRAFKNWTGTSPKQWQDNHASSQINQC